MATKRRNVTTRERALCVVGELGYRAELAVMSNDDRHAMVTYTDLARAMRCSTPTARRALHLAAQWGFVDTISDENAGNGRLLHMATVDGHDWFLSHKAYIDECMSVVKGISHGDK